MREGVVRTEGSKPSKAILINAIVIVIAAAVAIVFHAVLPAPVDALDFDSALVRLFGFPVVAVAYFLALFTHCAIVVRSFGRRANLPKLEIGFRFGLAFALLYLFGMQEVVVEASPFAEWGREFVTYQFFMGVGDALPVFVLCTVLAYATLAPRGSPTHGPTSSTRQMAAIAVSIALTFFLVRTIGHTTGIVESDVGRYPVQTHLWTLLFGGVLGCAYILLYPVFAHERRPVMLSVKLVLLTIGANWILFNSFIGLIFSGVMPQMLLRSGLDTTAMFLTSILVLRYLGSTRSYGRSRA